MGATITALISQAITSHYITLHGHGGQWTWTWEMDGDTDEPHHLKKENKMKM